MPDSPSPTRWLIRSLVVLTALLCLGVGGWAGQEAWARRVAWDFHEPFLSASSSDSVQVDLSGILLGWRKTPLYGAWFPGRNYPNGFGIAQMETIEVSTFKSTGIGYANNLGNTIQRLVCMHRPEGFHRIWRPRRTYYESLRLLTGENLPNDLEVWEAWYRSKTKFYWDARRKRLVATTPH